MLRRLSGPTHRVRTGVAAATGSHGDEVVTTEVTFRPLTDDEDRGLRGHGASPDKAGAYGIQGQGGARRVQRGTGRQRRRPAARVRPPPPHRRRHRSSACGRTCAAAPHQRTRGRPARQRGATPRVRHRGPRERVQRQPRLTNEPEVVLHANWRTKHLETAGSASALGDAPRRERRGDGRASRAVSASARSTSEAVRRRDRQAVAAGGAELDHRHTRRPARVSTARPTRRARTPPPVTAPRRTARRDVDGTPLTTKPDAGAHRHLGQRHAEAARRRRRARRRRAPSATSSRTRSATAVCSSRSSARQRAAAVRRARQAHAEPAERRLAPSSAEQHEPVAVDQAARRAAAGRAGRSRPSTPTTGVGSMSAPRRLVVEADVAADDRDAERAARLAHAVDGLGQLPHHLGVLGVAEVQAVDERERAGADAREVEHRLGHDQRGAGARVDRAPAVVAVGGERQRRGRCRRRWSGA